MKDIQTSLRSAFESSGLTYDELAKHTNLPKSALYRYINGDTEKIPIERFQLLCAELHVDAGALLGWKSEGSAFNSIIIPDNDKFRKVAMHMTPEDYQTVMMIFEKTYRRMKEKGEIE